MWWHLQGKCSFCNYSVQNNILQGTMLILSKQHILNDFIYIYISSVYARAHTENHTHLEVCNPISLIY